MNRIVPTVLKSERLILRPLLPDDAPRIECYASDRRVAEMTSLIPHPYPRGGASAWIAETEQAWLEGVRANFAICRRDSGNLVGSIGISADPVDGNVIGYWIGVAHWGNGYATEALRRLIRYAFEDLALDRIDTYHFAHNPASGRVMQKAGMKFIRKTPLGANREGIAYDDVRYAITAEEWSSQLSLQ